MAKTFDDLETTRREFEKARGENRVIDYAGYSVILPKMAADAASEVKKDRQ